MIELSGELITIIMLGGILVGVLLGYPLAIVVGGVGIVMGLLLFGRGLHEDFDEWLEKFAPHEPVSKYRHNRTGEDNADAHLKRTIMGREVVVAITEGRLDLGPWEQIFYAEFDGRRRKRVLVKIIGE